jgi:arylamine N-acetyltransferase
VQSRATRASSIIHSVLKASFLLSCYLSFRIPAHYPIALRSKFANANSFGCKPAEKANNSIFKQNLFWRTRTPQSAMADRPRYNVKQLTEYFDRICLPGQERVFDVSSLEEEDKLTYLELLKRHHLVKVPFENLTLHYSWHRVVNIKHQHVFEKVIRHPGRGGYCMEVNSLLHTILLSVGFNVRLVGVRVYDPIKERYRGYSHCANLVTIGGIRYLVDVGFGANGPTRPIPLSVDIESVQVFPAKVRLVHSSIAQNLDQDCKVWICQHRTDDDGDWVPIYCFTDFEFLPEDLQNMNLAPWKSQSSWFTQRVVAVRFTTEADHSSLGVGAAIPGSSPGVGEIDGVLIVNHDILKWRRKGETTLERHFRTDEERLEALEKYFSIVLEEEDREAIQGTVGEIKLARKE